MNNMAEYVSKEESQRQILGKIREAITLYLRIPGDVDQRSELMSISVPK